MSEREPLGVIAGSGQLPALLAREIGGARPIAVVSVTNDERPELEKRADSFKRLPVGQVHKVLSTFRECGVSELVILGGAQKATLFKPRRLDWLALKILARTKTRGDQSLFAAIAEEFESRGFRIADQRTYLPSLTLSEGVLTRRNPSKAQREDAQYALHLARSAAALDIGQTAVVKNGVPIAVEAIEGTDAAIRRAGELAGEGAVAGKACRPDHDFRFDAPTVGLQTLESLIAAKAGALALEAGRVFLLDRGEFARKADEAKIAVLALNPPN